MAYLHVLRVKSTGRSGGSPVGLRWDLKSTSRGCLPNAAAPAIEAPSSRGGLATRGSGPHYKPESAAAEPNGNDEFARYVSVTFPGTALGGRRASATRHAPSRGAGRLRVRVPGRVRVFEAFKTRDRPDP